MSRGTDAASVAINQAARIGKARALLGLGLSNAPAAAALVANIPTTYRYDVTASLTGGNNILWSQGASQNRYTVSDSVQGNARNIFVKNAIPFLSAKDPRVPAHYKVASNGRDTVKSQDGNTYVIQVDSLWGQTTAVAVVRGTGCSVDRGRGGAAGRQRGGHDDAFSMRSARPSQTITNPSPQASGTHPGWKTPVMPALTDPGTAAGRVNCCSVKRPSGSLAAVIGWAISVVSFATTDARRTARTRSQSAYTFRAATTALT